MNWLAHLYLSRPDAAFRLGNLLPDILPRPALLSLPRDFQGGIAQHRQIDAFTDTHPVFRQSIRRVDPAFRRYGGILCDLFYDHFLARDWQLYSSEPLPDFIQAVYNSMDDFQPALPPEANARLEQIRNADWLGSYQSLEGLARALERMGTRLKRPVMLAQSLPSLEKNYASFHADFRQFFPAIRSYLSA
jgi:acyl carrier protein phosphodiesterase